jgi:hypothetical protein
MRLDVPERVPPPTRTKALTLTSSLPPGAFGPSPDPKGNLSFHSSNTKRVTAGQGRLQRRIDASESGKVHDSARCGTSL